MNASSLSKAARRAASMNEEQKAFIDNLVKNNSDHGLRFGSKKPVKTVNYKGEEKTVDDLMEIVNPKNSLNRKTVNEVRTILTLIVNDDRYDYYNAWIKRKGMKSSVSKENTYSNRLFNIVKDLIEGDETKLLQDDYSVAHKVKTDRNNDKYRLEKSSNIETNENDQYFDETNDINLNEIDEKSDKPNDEKTIENNQNLPDELSLNNERSFTDKPLDDKSSSDNDNDNDNEEEKIKFESAPVLKNKDKTADIIPKSPIIEKGEKKEPNEKQLFKNIELALSYKNNKEYQDNNVLEFKGKNGKIYKPDEPYKKLKALVHQKIADYIEELYNKFGYNSSEFRRLKQEIIDKINRRYFGKNNEYGFSVNNRGTERAFEIKYLEGPKQKRRADKNYVNQNTPNKDVFFKYSMKDVYDIIEEYLSIKLSYSIKLSVHSKSLIESIVSSSVDRYVKNAEKLGQVSYHTIAHGFDRTEDLSAGVIKLIEKYINSKRNIHIKMKFEFDSDSRSKLMEIINREISINQNDNGQKSKNIMSFIDSLKFT